MKIKIPKAQKDIIADKLVKYGFEKEAGFFSQLHYGGDKDDISVEVRCGITLGFLNKLKVIAKDLSLRAVQTACTQYIAMTEDPNNNIIKSLKSLEQGLISFLKDNYIDGWLYHAEKDNSEVPYMVTSIKFHPADKSRESPATLKVHLFCSTPRSSGSSVDSITFHNEDISRLSIPQALARKGYFKETAEFRDRYEKSIEQFFEFQPKFGEQFTSTAVGLPMGSGYSYHTVDFSKGRSVAKLVNDDGVKKVEYSSYRESYFWQQQDVDEGQFENVPFHPYIKMFDLDKHDNYWVHSRFLTPYVYNPSLADKIVLPDDHRDLIDLLVDDMDVIMDDFVEGKSGGSTVLCMGAPGLGKTLTAEIYSEVIQRPLYRVHSGQLGTSPDSIEKKLTEILERSERWKSVLLIDEADVYIRKRDNSMNHNAIVAAFLRKLEYFSGLLFLTTNREKDVDDAIKSRCIAMIVYQTPVESDAKLIWKNLSAQFKIKLSSDLIDSLVKKLPNCSGRDIKELLKLVSKYNRIKNKEINVDLFRKCAIFRGIEMTSEKKIIEGESTEVVSKN